MGEEIGSEKENIASAWNTKNKSQRKLSLA